MAAAIYIIVRFVRVVPFSSIVSTITLPGMRWKHTATLLRLPLTYSTTSEFLHGARPATRGNIVGPMGFTDDGNNITLLGYEGWCAVEEEPGIWGISSFSPVIPPASSRVLRDFRTNGKANTWICAVGVYFDREDGEHRLPKGKRVVEISLYRYVEEEGKGERSNVDITPGGKR